MFARTTKHYHCTVTHTLLAHYSRSSLLRNNKPQSSSWEQVASTLIKNEKPAQDVDNSALKKKFTKREAARIETQHHRQQQSKQIDNSLKRLFPSVQKEQQTQHVEPPTAAQVKHEDIEKVFGKISHLQPETLRKRKNKPHFESSIATTTSNNKQHAFSSKSVPIKEPASFATAQAPTLPPASTHSESELFEMLFKKPAQQQPNVMPKPHPVTTTSLYDDETFEDAAKHKHAAPSDNTNGYLPFKSFNVKRMNDVLPPATSTTEEHNGKTKTFHGALHLIRHFAGDRSSSNTDDNVVPAELCEDEHDANDDCFAWPQDAILKHEFEHLKI